MELRRETLVTSVAAPLGGSGNPLPISPIPASQSALQPSVWLACATASIFAWLLILQFNVAIDYFSLLAALGVLGFFLTVYVVYGRWRGSPRLSNLCGVLAAMAWSGGMAGIISLVGLRDHSTLIDE